MKLSAAELHTVLKNNLVEVTFTKVNGDLRVMTCTLQATYLPEEYKNKGQLIGEAGSAHFSVWDTNANGWRSFRLESVSSVKINGEEYTPSRTLLTE